MCLSLCECGAQKRSHVTRTTPNLKCLASSIKEIVEDPNMLRRGHVTQTTPPSWAVHLLLANIIIIIITDLYSAFKSKDTEALGAAQED